MKKKYSIGLTRHLVLFRMVQKYSRPLFEWLQLRKIELFCYCKVKVKPLCLTKHHAMKTYWGSRGIAPRILVLALDGGERSALRSGRFTPKEKAPGTYWIGGWVGPRTVLDTAVKRKIPRFCYCKIVNWVYTACVCDVQFKSWRS
jgi:hypothetical protein